MRSCSRLSHSDVCDAGLEAGPLLHHGEECLPVCSGLDAVSKACQSRAAELWFAAELNCDHAAVMLQTCDNAAVMLQTCDNAADLR